MHAPPGEEGFAGVGRILAFQGGVEHRIEVLVFAVLHQPFQRPLGEAVQFGHLDLFQLGSRFAGVLVVQLRNDLKVGGEHPQLGGRTQLQLAAFVDVEGLVGAVRLHPHPRAVFGALEQREAVAHLVGGLGGQQALADQPDLCRKLGVGEVFQVLAYLHLQVGLQGAGGRQVEAVEVVQRAVEHGRQAITGQADAFVGDDRNDGRLRHPVAIHRLAGQRRVGQRLVDDLVGGEYANMRVGEFGQFDPAFGQVMRGAALGDHQRQHLAQGQATRGQAFRVLGGRGQGLVDLVEIGAVPHPQALSHAMHFAVARHSRKRHAVEVVAHDALARLGGVRAALIGTHAGRNHLANLLGARNGQAVR
ncbi:hypothetical protein D3C76_695150 [compost metagenome]